MGQVRHGSATYCNPSDDLHGRSADRARTPSDLQGAADRPVSYYDHLSKRAKSARLSDRNSRDEAPRPEILRVFDENWRAYGVRRVWRQLVRGGFDVARCTVARLMKDMSIQDIIRGKPLRTTIPDKKVPCRLDKLNREFRVPAPNMF